MGNSGGMRSVSIAFTLVRGFAMTYTPLRMRSDLVRWRESEWQLGRALYDMISRWKRMGRFAILMGSYTHLIFLSPSPASHQGGRRNEEQTLLRDHCGACLKRWVLPPRGLPSMRWLRLCLRRAATSFFLTAKKGSKKCRSHAPRGLHSAKRFAGRTPCAGLRGGLQEGGGLRDGLARCARWFYRRVFWDGLFAMAFLNA